MTPVYTKAHYRRMLAADLVSFFGSSLTWTGLPFFMAKLSGDGSNFSGLFLAYAAANLVISPYGGLLADRYSQKTLGVIFCAVNAATLVAMALAIDRLSLPAYYIGTMLLAAGNALAVPSIDAWFKTIADEVRPSLERGLADRNLWLLLAKLAGFALGPFMFDLLGVFALLADAATYAIEGLLLALVPWSAERAGRTAEPRPAQAAGASLMRPDFWTGERAMLSVMSLCGGLLAQPLVNLALLRAAGNPPEPQSVSLFWIVLAIAAFGGNLAVRQGWIDARAKPEVILIAALIETSGLLLIGLGPTPHAALAGVALAAFATPILGTAIGAATFRAVDAGDRGSFGAIQSALMQVGVLAGLAMLLNGGNAIAVFVCLGVLAALLRGWLWRAGSMSHRQERKNA